MTNHIAEKTIRRLDKQWGAAATRLDLKAVVKFYAPDGALVWPEFEMVRGTAGIRKMWREMLKIPGLKLRFTPERIDVAEAGDVAVDYGKVEFTQLKDGRPVKEIAKYLVVWTKVRGEWRVAYDSYNSNQKAPAA